MMIELIIPNTHLIHSYLKYDWEQVKTFEDVLNFYHKWHNDLLRTERISDVRAMCIKQVIYPLYSIITNKSYESKILQL